MFQLAVIGGFLGSGKTTFIRTISIVLQDRGLRVGVVVNDQGEQNIDKVYLEQELKDVLDVKNGCFCCNLPDFINSIEALKEKVDIVFAEPSGSCTDLVATVFSPLKELEPDIVFLPFTVIVDPKKALRIVEMKDETSYLFEQQIKEADIVLLNKIDLYDKEIVNRAKSIIEGIARHKDILEICAKEESYACKWMECISSLPIGYNALHDIDYSSYAKAEKSLAWFDGSIDIESFEEVDTDQILYSFAERLLGKMNEEGVIIEHIKIYIFSEIGTAKLSIVGNGYEDIIVDRTLPMEVKRFNMLISCRVKEEAAKLKEEVIEVMEDVLGAFKKEWIKINAFSPKEPKPFMRKTFQ